MELNKSGSDFQPNNRNIIENKLYQDPKIEQNKLYQEPKVNRQDLGSSQEAKDNLPSTNWLTKVLSIFIKKEKPQTQEISIPIETIKENYKDKLRELSDRSKPLTIDNYKKKIEILTELDSWLNRINKETHEEDQELVTAKDEIEQKLNTYTDAFINGIKELIETSPTIDNKWEKTAENYNNVFDGIQSCKFNDPKMQELQSKAYQLKLKLALHNDAKTPLQSPDDKKTLKEEKKKLNAIKRDFVNFSFDSISILPYRYQGISSHQSLFSLIQYYKDFINNNENKSEQSEKNAEILDNAYNILLNINTIKEFKFKGTDDQIEKLEQELYENIHQQIENLQDGEKILIPGGTASHTFVYEFEKQENGKLQFKVVNTGPGVEFHHSPSFLPSLNLNAKIQTYLIQDIDPQAVNPEFIGQLISAQLATKYHYLKMFTDQFNPMGGTKKIYKAIKAKLLVSGKDVKIPDKKSKMIYREQRNNVCAKKAYTCWLRQNLPEEEMKAFKAEATAASLAKLHEVKKFEDEKRKPEWLPRVSNWFRELSSPIARIGMVLTNQFPTASIIALGERIELKRRNKAAKKNDDETA